MHEKIKVIYFIFIKQKWAIVAIDIIDIIESVITLISITLISIILISITMDIMITTTVIMDVEIASPAYSEMGSEVANRAMGSDLVSYEMRYHLLVE